MTSMKGTPVSTFNATIRNLMSKSVKDACAAFEINVVDEAPVVRKAMAINGDYLAGISVSGTKFSGAITLSMDKAAAKSFADKIFAGTPAKANEAMLCDLVGEVCNQMTGVVQRQLGQLGCKLQVSAQETAQSPSTLDMGPVPEEWLLIPFKVSQGRGVLGFGFVGDLGIGSDEVQEDLSDARNITFF
jgi:CheY-specific phosphatase CheX